MFCSNCGEKISDVADVCIKCGVSVKKSTSMVNKDEEKWLITLLLCFFAGTFGVHRFYTGHTGIGIAQLLTLGGCGIWTLVDFILIILNSYKDSEGNTLKPSN